MKKDEVKLRRVDAALQQRGLDALICRLPENVFYLSGYWPLAGFSFIVYSRYDEPFLVVPEGEADPSFRDFTKEGWVDAISTFTLGTPGMDPPLWQVAETFRKWRSGKGNLRIGYEASSEAVAPCYNAAELLVPALPTMRMMQEAIANATWHDATDLLDELKSIKTQRDVTGIRLANEIAGFGLYMLPAVAQPGAKEIEIAAQIEAHIASAGLGYKGSRRVRAWAFVMSGCHTREGYRPFNLTTDRRVEEGDPVMLELATVVDGYWSDLTRMHVPGRPSGQLEEIFGTVLEAQQRSVHAVRAGEDAAAIDQVARSIITTAGYGKYFRHHTGHGVGFRYHEPIPSVNPESKGLLLEAGMVTSIEPGIYTEELGVRIEDDVLVLDGGQEVLSPFERGLSSETVSASNSASPAAN